MFTLSLTDSLCRYQRLDREEGVRAWVWHLDTSFVPSLEILTTKFALNCDLIIPKKGYFIKLELFSSPKGQEFDQKIGKKKERKGKSNATTMPMSPPRSIQTLIPTLMVTYYAFNL